MNPLGVEAHVTWTGRGPFALRSRIVRGRSRDRPGTLEPNRTAKKDADQFHSIDDATPEQAHTAMSQAPIFKLLHTVASVLPRCLMTIGWWLAGLAVQPDGLASPARPAWPTGLAGWLAGLAGWPAG